MQRFGRRGNCRCSGTHHRLQVQVNATSEVSCVQVVPQQPRQVALVTPGKTHTHMTTYYYWMHDYRSKERAGPHPHPHILCGDVSAGVRLDLGEADEGIQRSLTAKPRVRSQLQRQVHDVGPQALARLHATDVTQHIGQHYEPDGLPARWWRNVVSPKCKSAIPCTRLRKGRGRTHLQTHEPAGTEQGSMSSPYETAAASCWAAEPGWHGRTT